MTSGWIEPSDEADVELARAVGEAIGHRGDGDRFDRHRLRTVMAATRRSASAAGVKAVTSGRWLAGVTLETAGHLPVRDLETLRHHYDGRAGALLAKPLIRNASLASAAVGATTGSLAAASQTTPATWVALPVELAVETLVVVAIEMKLAAELHEAAGYPVAHDLRANGPLIARAWSETRGLDPRELAQLARPGHGPTPAMMASELLGRSARDQLINQIRRRLLRRAGRNSTIFIPLMAGAVVGGALNQRVTHRFGRQVAATLGISPP